MSSEEISQLRGSPSHGDRVERGLEDAGTGSRKTTAKSAKSTTDRRQSPEADSMDVDDFDDY